MKLLMIPVISAFLILLGIQGCTDGGMAAEQSCIPLTAEDKPIGYDDTRETAMTDNMSRIADEAGAQPEAAAVRKLETATFALG